MSTSKIGSRWWKFDIHTHTPHSTDTGHWRKAEGTTEEITPERWLRAHAEMGVNCVAVTDHNGAGWFDRLSQDLQSLKNAEPETFSDLTLFPGVEVSVNGGDHVLAIFSTDKPSSYIERFLGAIGVDGTSGDPVPRSEKSMYDVAKTIHELGGLCIPAHVDASNGYFRTDDDGKLVNDYGTILKLLQSGWLSAVEVRNPSWQPHEVFTRAGVELAKVRGTDCHSFRNFGSPGTIFTWIKMGTPSLEGLRLALMDTSDFSVRRSDQVDASFNPNLTATTWIESLEVAGLTVMGDRQPQTAYFSPWLTSLVGGRGTGKSTMLDCMRICFDRMGDLVPELADEFESFFSIAKTDSDDGVLTDTSKLTAIITRETGRYRLTWNAGDRSRTIQVQDEEGNWTETEGDVYQRFPIRVLTQKEIYQVASDPAALIELIDTSPSLQLNDWREAHELKLAELRHMRSAIRERRAKASAKSRLAGELAEIEAKIRLFETGENQQVLARFQAVGRQEKAFSDVGDLVDEFGQDIDEVATKWSDASVDATAFDTVTDSEALQALAAAETALADAQKQLKQISAGLATFKQTWDAELLQSAWHQSKTQATTAYQKLAGSMAEAGVSNLSQYGPLLQQRTNIKKQLDEIKTAETEAIEHQNLWDKRLVDLAEMHCQRSQRRKDFLAEVLDGNQYVRARVMSFGTKPIDCRNQFREMVGLGNDRFEVDVLSREGDRGILSQLYDSLPHDDEERQAELLSRVQKVKADCQQMANGGGAVEECTERFAKYLQKLQPEDLDELWHWFPDDLIEFEYRKDPNTDSWERLERGSPGQKTAALLAFLLSHGTEPIILDQPEDDLDNHLIYDLVVRQIRESKASRQIIVATHNPNIVVNGDAEKVLSMTVQHERCVIQNESSGCLQDAAVREEVCKVMEGGRDAFLRRYQRMIPPNSRGTSQ